MNRDRLDWHLDNWAKYMQGGLDLGARISSLYGSGGVSGEDEFDVMCEKADKVSARAFDGCVESLPRPQRTAINHVWLGSSFCWPTHELDYEMAIENLVRLAEKRGIV